MTATQSADSATNLVPLDSKKHAGLGLNQAKLDQHSARQNAITISLAEFFYASHHYPIAFLKPSPNVVQACAITGLKAQQNLFTDNDGVWQQQAYIPATIRRYPFYTAKAKQASADGEFVVMVDESALSESTDPYFDSSGTATDTWLKAQKLISDIAAADQLTTAFCAKLDELGLLKAFDAQINPRQQDSMQVTGMYRVEENILNRLPASQIQALMQGGELSRIYAHLISLENFAKLLERNSTDAPSKANTN